MGIPVLAAEKILNIIVLVMSLTAIILGYRILLRTEKRIYKSVFSIVLALVFCVILHTIEVLIEFNYLGQSFKNVGVEIMQLLIVLFLVIGLSNLDKAIRTEGGELRSDERLNNKKRRH